MIDPKELRKQCAECPQAGVFTEEQHRKCQTCITYNTLNTLCTVCRQIGGVVSFNVSRRGKASQIDACPACIELLNSRFFFWSARTLKKKMKITRSRRLALALIIIVSTIFAVIFLSPDVRYSILDQDKTLFQSGGLSFTVGDFIGIFSLIAAATSIAVFIETVRHKK